MKAAGGTAGRPPRANSGGARSRPSRGESALGKTAEVDGGAAANPFQLPDDEEIFKMREEEALRKTQEREAVRGQHIWEKTTQSSRMGLTRKVIDLEAEPEETAMTRQAKATRGLVAAATAAISNERRREKENMADFIAKKREMFLVQMSLDTKREEIRKLEQKAHMKEEALKKSELMLEEDAIRFDAFLKENDKKAHEAIKNADREAKLKADKMQEIKRLKHSISVVMSEKVKCKDALDDCKRYKEFLDSLTPPEFFDEQKRLKAQRQYERRVAAYQRKLAQWQAARDDAEAEFKRQEEEARRRAKKEGRQIAKRESQANAWEAALPPPPRLEDEETVSSGEEVPMYFQHPQQLLDIFTQLEEGNLFLIQNCQQTEQQLEELKQTYRETEAAMIKQSTALSENTSQLRSQIEREESKADALRSRVTENTGEDNQEHLLKQLRSKVKTVYRNCGFDADANPDTLSMLTSLEGMLEDLLSQIATMKPEYVKAKEKEKEKERRERVRQEKLTQVAKMYEDRLKKSMERAQAPAKKKVGKQVMFRSQPLRRRNDDDGNNVARDQEDEDMIYLT